MEFKKNHHYYFYHFFLSRFLHSLLELDKFLCGEYLSAICFLVMLKQIQKKSHNQQQQLYYYQNFKDITKCDIGAFKYYLM